MKSDKKFFKNSKLLPVDKFFHNVLYDKKLGYYSSKHPFGKKGDFITAPILSNIFSEIISIWIISTWEKLGQPANLNIIELGPGDGSFIKIFLNISKKFQKFNSSINIFLYEKSRVLKELQKKNIKNKKIKWIENFRTIKKGPVIFFGNEFFDAVPIKQFKKSKKSIYEKCFIFEKGTKVKEVFKRANKNDIKSIKAFKVLRNLEFIEFPKSGLNVLDKVTKVILKQGGCLLLIDYGYLKPNNQDTLQSVFKNRKNNLFNNLGRADISAHVNFSLLKEFFLKKNLEVERIVTQKEFLSRMGIHERSELIAKKMSFIEKTNLYLRVKRLLSPKLMGELFKVILAFKFKEKKFFGFR